MALGFTVKEANQLIERHKKLLAQVGYVNNCTTRIIADIKQSANDLLVQATLKKIILSDCVSPLIDISESKEIERFVEYLYKYHIVRSAHDTIKILQGYTTNISQSIALLNPGIPIINLYVGFKDSESNSTEAFLK